MGIIACREIGVETTDGSSRQDRICYIFSLEVKDLEVEEELSTVATLFWAEGVWMKSERRKQQKAWKEPYFLKYRDGHKVRGLAGAVLCETRDLGIQWPQWHT